MIAAWMLYCALCALGLFVAASVAEHVLLAGRRAVRPVWLGAVLLSLAVPVVALRYGSDPRPARVAVDAREGVALDSSAMLAEAATPPVVGSAQAPAATSPTSWRAVVARADRPLLVVWLVLSIALACYFVGGMIVLAVMRRGWRRHVVLDVPVLVSQSVGPALVGAMSPAIVLPEWAIGMEPRQLALMLKHEEEHRRARDGQVLTAAQLALIAMPWNVALWWQVLRLRMAVELDCDARVLRDADARAYGDLLLDVVRPNGGLRLMGATAFAERASQLERRIRVLAKPRRRVVRGSRAAAASIGLIAAAAAWVAPRPAAPMITLFARISPTTQMPVASAQDSKISQPVPDTLPAPLAAAATTPKQRARPSQLTADTIVTRRRFVGDSLVRTPGSPSASAESPGDDSLLYHRLFDGISLTASQQTAAHALLANLMRRQLGATVSAITSGLQSRATVIAARDSALRALVSDDADRALLASRMAPGARGRSGGPPDGLGGGRGGRSGGGGGGSGVPTDGAPGDAGGARGRSGGAGVPSAVALEMQFNRLFNGITLTPEQEASARTLIGLAMQAMQSPVPRPVMVIEALPTGVVAVQPDAATSLLALLANAAERQVLESRLAIAPPPTSTPPRQ